MPVLEVPVLAGGFAELPVIIGHERPHGASIQVLVDLLMCDCGSALCDALGLRPGWRTRRATTIFVGSCGDQM